MIILHYILEEPPFQISCKLFIALYGLFINLTHLDIVAISNYIRCKALYWKYWHQMGLNVLVQYFPYCFKMLTSKLPEWREEIKRFYSQTPYIMLHERVMALLAVPFVQFLSYLFDWLQLAQSQIWPHVDHQFSTSKLEHCVPFRRDHRSFTLHALY